MAITEGRRVLITKIQRKGSGNQLGEFLAGNGILRLKGRVGITAYNSLFCHVINGVIGPVVGHIDKHNVLVDGSPFYSLVLQHIALRVCQRHNRQQAKSKHEQKHPSQIFHCTFSLSI
ncbi:hypothetical protein D3C76_1573280 [compost metagenome]